MTDGTHRPTRGSSQRIVDALRSGAEVTRGELADRTGLSRATVSALVRDLERDGLVALGTGEPAVGRTGRRPEVVRLTRRAGAVLGVDFGHEHVRVAVSDLAGNVLCARSARADVDRGMESALAVARRLSDLVAEEAGVDRSELLACGAGVPAPVDRATGRIGSTSLLPSWSGTTLTAALEQVLEMPVVVDNDANLGALGEQAAGAARGVDDAIYVKVSSGVGAGLISGGRLLRGSTGIAGEIGHVAVVPNGVPCRCGGRGCLETIASAPAVRRQLLQTTGHALPGDDLLRALSDGDPRVTRLLADAGRSIGRVLAAACHLLDPAVIVLGGDPAFSTEPVLSGLREELDRHRLPGAGGDVRILPAQLGHQGQVVGALRLAARSLDGRAPQNFSPITT
ncbi:ROK family transcriptional regulator [Patulibacter sp.]|uniref:ROK family transcriptional regulator n=1 Tax=Patulibacter sp. TaxID=1912859 RepID=UPI00272690D8|nr:ROK family transcriptional regulator [Patulibacter sp.]MDO9408140.1 ROK family transcriptional regulator [Patulibacter sp.]